MAHSAKYSDSSPKASKHPFHQFLVQVAAPTYSKPSPSCMTRTQPNRGTIRVVSKAASCRPTAWPGLCHWRPRCVPLDSLVSVGGSCLECVRLFVGGIYGGGVIAARCRMNRVGECDFVLTWSYRVPVHLGLCPLWCGCR